VTIAKQWSWPETCGKNMVCLILHYCPALDLREDSSINLESRKTITRIWFKKRHFFILERSDENR